MTFLLTVGAVTLGGGLWLWVLRRYDRVEPEGYRDLVLVALGGGALTVVPAAFINEALREALGIHVGLFEGDGAGSLGALVLLCLGVGLLEETLKAVGAVTATRLVGDLNEPLDAMIYAMTAALGFAAMESAFYALRFGNDVLLVRFLWPVPAHMAYAALWGYGWAYVCFLRPRHNVARGMAPYVAGAGLVHAAANLLLFEGGTETALISLAVLAALGWVAHHRLLGLIAESPFLMPGECFSCRHRNPPKASRCARCGEALRDTELFTTCPCGLTRVPKRLPDCPVCGETMPKRED